MATVPTVVRPRDAAPERAALWRHVAAVGCALFLAGLFYAQVLHHPDNGSDFQIDYQAAMALRERISPSLAAQSYLAGQGDANHYFYAPTFAALVLPLTLLPEQTAYHVWGACMLAFLLLAVYALLRSAGARASPLLLFALADAAALTTAMRSEFFLGNVNLFLLACLSLGLWARQERRPILGGVLLALACVTKPMWLLFPLFLLWKREYRFAGSSLAIFASLLLAPFIWLGARSFRALLSVWASFTGGSMSFNENFAPLGLLMRLFTPNPFVHPVVIAPALALTLWVLIAAAVAVATLALVERRPLHRDARSLLEVGLIVPAVLLMSPLTELPYLSLLTITIVGAYLALRETAWRRPPLLGFTLGYLVVWAVACIPRRALEDVFWVRRVEPSLLGDLFMLLAASQFYILLAAFLLQLALVRQLSGRRLRAAIPRVFRDLAQLPSQTAADLAAARR